MVHSQRPQVVSSPSTSLMDHLPCSPQTNLTPAVRYETASEGPPPQKCRKNKYNNNSLPQSSAYFSETCISSERHMPITHCIIIVTCTQGPPARVLFLAKSMLVQRTCHRPYITIERSKTSCLSSISACSVELRQNVKILLPTSMSCGAKVKNQANKEARNYDA